MNALFTYDPHRCADMHDENLDFEAAVRDLLGLIYSSPDKATHEGLISRCDSPPIASAQASSSTPGHANGMSSELHGQMSESSGAIMVVDVGSGGGVISSSSSSSVPDPGEAVDALVYAVKTLVARSVQGSRAPLSQLVPQILSALGTTAALVTAATSVTIEANSSSGKKAQIFCSFFW